MQKKAGLLLTALCMFGSIYAQFSVGVKAGVNISKENYTKTDVYTTRNHVFGTAGLLARYIHRKSLGIETGLFFSPEGTYEEYEGGGGKVTGIVTITRINWPLLVQYHLPSGLYFETGPQAGFRLSSKGKYTNGDFDFKKNTRPVLFSWDAGIGVKQLTDRVPGLGIDACFSKGLGNVNNGTVNGGKITASTLSLRLVYIFQKAHS